MEEEVNRLEARQRTVSFTREVSNSAIQLGDGGGRAAFKPQKLSVFAVALNTTQV